MSFFYGLLGAAFSPLSLSPYLWLDAGQGVEVTTGNPAADTNTVQRWLDQSGNGAHALQAAAGSRMQYRTNIVNSLPVMRGTTSKIMRGVLPAVSNSAVTIISVVSLSASNRHAIFGLTDNSTDNLPYENLSFELWNDSNIRAVYKNAGSGSTAAQSAYTYSSGWFVHSIIINGSSIVQYVNNTQIGSVTLAGTVSKTDYVLASRGGGVQSLLGDLAEILVFPVLSVANHTAVARYLGAKYGITVS